MSNGNASDNTYDQLIEEIPRYNRFFTPQEHDVRSRQLARQYENVTVETIGKSRDGNDLLCLDIGSGSKTALMFAAPHPNEPIGSMMLDFLSEHLASNDEFRESFDWRFLLIKCIDYDGAVLNDGWFDGPYTTLNYAANFYRPPSHDQVEWTFPIDYKTLSFDEPLPETYALMDIINEERPDFVYSLHNAAFGGCYYYLSHQFEDHYETLRNIPTELGIPLDLGEPETPWMTQFDDAIWEQPTVKDRYEYLAENLDEDPANIITGGTGSIDYARGVNDDVVSLITELPYFYDPKVEDNSPSERKRREVILEGTERTEDIIDFLAEQYHLVQDNLVKSKFDDAVSDIIERSRAAIEAQRSWAQSEIPEDEIATVSQRFDALVVSQFYRLLYFGVLIRAIDQTLISAEDQNDLSHLVDAKLELEQEFYSLNEELFQSMEYRTIPIWKLVAVQLQAGLVMLDRI